MRVLFWVDTFPSCSETFIRDQIVSLLDNNLEVLICVNDNGINTKEIDALSGFESYGLLEKVVDIDHYFKTNRFLRCFNALWLLVSNSFNKKFKLYKAALSFSTYGKQARSFRLLFRVHFLIEQDIDIIHAHFGPNGNKAAVFKAIGLPIQLFTTFHGYDIRLGLKKGGHFYHHLFERADGIIAISDFNYDHLLRFGARKASLIKLPNGIDTTFFKRLNQPLNTNKLKLLTVARLVNEKSIDIALSAVAKVRNLKPDVAFEYVIVGEGKQRQDLEALIAALGMEDVVKLVGSKTTKEVRNLMIQSDLFLLSSSAEALPTVVLEAQAAGLVVLATDVGAVHKIVKGGMVVPPNQVEAFAEGLLNILSKRSDWPVLAQYGRDFVCKYHNIQDHTKALLEHYTLKSDQLIN